MAGQTATISAIYRYPVKGLSAEKLDGAELRPGEALAWDRAFAIENGGREFDPQNPVFMPKTRFLMLQRDESLAALETRFDAESGVLSIYRAGKQVARGNLTQTIGRQLIEQFIAAYMGEHARGAPHIVHAPGHTISDCGAKVISLINLATLRDLERVTGGGIDPLRFRANLYVDGIEPWAEFDWVEQKIGNQAGVVLEGVQRIVRCAATNVNPRTAERDLNIPRTLQDAFGHGDCGVYMRVESGGPIKPGDTLSALPVKVA